jgi:hypothetical protein
MKRVLLRPTLIAFTVATCASLALAQNPAQPEPANPQPAAPNETKKDTVPPATDKSEATRAGTQEPSAKIQSTATDTSAFVNGTLAAPGAPTNVDTAPAKFSSRSAGDDALPIAAYTLRHLTEDQRRGLLEALRAQQGTRLGAADEGFTKIGAEVPTMTALSGLSALPDSVTANLPVLRDVVFASVGDKFLLINPRTRVVIGILG